MNRERFVKIGTILDNVAAAVLAVWLGAVGINQTNGDWRITLVILILNPFLFIGLRWLWHHTLGLVIMLIIGVITIRPGNDD